METNWYTIYTMPNSGKKVADTLNRKKVDYFYPSGALSAEKGIVKDNQNFDRYVFLKISENQIAQFKKLMGLLIFCIV